MAGDYLGLWSLLIQLRDLCGGGGGCRAQVEDTINATVPKSEKQYVSHS